MLDVIAWLIVWLVATLIIAGVLSGRSTSFYDDLKASIAVQFILAVFGAFVSSFLWAVDRIWGL